MSDDSILSPRGVAPRRWTRVLGLPSAILFVILARMGRETGFFFDEWNFLVYRRGLSLDTLLQPHNGHLVVIPNAVYSTLGGVFGIDSYTPFRCLVLLLHLSVAILCAIVIGRVRGNLSAIAALIVVAMLGVGWQNIFWAFQIGFVGSIASFLVAWLLLDSTRGELGARRGACAALALLVSVAMSGVGLAALGATWVLCVSDSRRRRMWWIPMGPSVAYVLWYLVYGASAIDLGALDRVPQFALVNAGSSAGGFFGLDVAWGQLILGMALLVAVVSLRKNERLLWSLLPSMMYIVFVVLATLSRSANFEPDASRYTYLGAVVLIATLGIAGEGRHSSGGRWPVVTLTILALWGSHDILRDGAHNLRREWDIVSTELAVVDLYGEALDPTLMIDSVHAPQLTVGTYRNLVAELGTVSSKTISEVEAAGPDARSGVDALLATLVMVDHTDFVGEDCVAAGPSVSEVLLPAGSSLLVSPWTPGLVNIRRFAPETTRSAARELDSAILEFSAPEDEIDVPYVLIFDGQVEVVTCP